MPFYPPNPGRRPFNLGNRQRFGPPHSMRRQPRSFIAPNRNQQAPASRFQGLKTTMGHVGNITNGINMLRQFGSFFKFFK